MAANEWRIAGFGPFDYARTIPRVIRGAPLVVLGTRAAIFGFLVTQLAKQGR